MEQFNQKEKIFKNILDDVQFDVDSSEIWNQIEDRIPNKKRNRKALWLWSTGALFLATIVLWSVSIKNIPLTKITENIIVSNSTIESPTIPNNKNRESNSKTSFENKNKLAAYNRKKKEVLNIIPLENKLKNRSAHNNSTIEINNNSNFDIRKPKTILNNSINTNHPGINSNNYNSIPSIKQSTKYTITKIPHIDYDNKLSPILNVALLPLKSIELFNLEHNQSFIPNNLNSTVLRPSEHNKWQPYYALYTGINRNNSTYQLSKNKTENTIKGINFETGMMGISTDIIYGQTNQNRWRWYTGIGHQFIVSRYQNQTQEITESFVEGTTGSYIDGNNNVIQTTGLLKKITIKNNDITWHRRHQLIDLKLGIGKQLYQFGRFRLHLEAGAAITILSNHKGYYFANVDNDVIIIKDGDEHPYTNFGNLKFNGRISIDYSLGRFALGLSSFYSKDLNSSTQSTNYYSLQNTPYGLQFSILYCP